MCSSARTKTQEYAEAQVAYPGVTAFCRDEVALHRLKDSTKMWSTLKKIAQAELADSSSQATDSVTLRFLSLAPRIARLNTAVRVGLLASSCAEASAEGAGAADSSASHAQR